VDSGSNAATTTINEMTYWRWRHNTCEKQWWWVESGRRI